METYNDTPAALRAQFEASVSFNAARESYDALRYSEKGDSWRYDYETLRALVEGAERVGAAGIRWLVASVGEEAARKACAIAERAVMDGGQLAGVEAYEEIKAKIDRRAAIKFRNFVDLLYALDETERYDTIASFAAGAESPRQRIKFRVVVQFIDEESAARGDYSSAPGGEIVEEFDTLRAALEYAWNASGQSSIDETTYESEAITQSFSYCGGDWLGGSICVYPISPSGRFVNMTAAGRLLTRRGF